MTRSSSSSSKVQAMTKLFKEALLEVSGDSGTATTLYNSIAAGAVAANMHEYGDYFSQEVVDLLQTLAGWTQARQLIIRFASNTQRGNNLGEVGADHVLNALSKLKS